MRMLILIATLAAFLAAPALAGENDNGLYESFGCVTAKLQAGQGEGYNLNFVPFGKLKLGNGNGPPRPETVEKDVDWGKPPTEVCGQIVGIGGDGPFDPPTRILAESCGPATPERPYQLFTTLQLAGSEAYGRLKIMQPVMKHDGPICKPDLCACVQEPCECCDTVAAVETKEPKDGKGPPPRPAMVRGTGALNVNTLYPQINQATEASTHIVCHPLNFDKKKKMEK